MIFRPYSAQITDQTEYDHPLDKGYYYKFNSNLEIKLVKLTLEDNGFIN